jgi:hypothetical protein
MYALAEFPTQDQIARTIDLALSGDVKTQDAPFLLNRCIANREHGPFAWERVRRQWPELVEKFPDNTIVRMINSITTLTTPHVVADVQGFFSEHPIPQSAKTWGNCSSANSQRRTAPVKPGAGQRPHQARGDLDVQLLRCVTEAQRFCRTCRRWSWNLGDEGPALRRADACRCEGASRNSSAVTSGRPADNTRQRSLGQRSSGTPMTAASATSS